MTSADLDGPLVLRRSPRRQLPTLAGIATFLVAYLVAGALGVIRPWLVWVGVVVFGGVLLAGLYGAVKGARASHEALRLDRDGVTVPGHPTVPWSDLTEVRVTGLQPRWIFPVSLGYRVVAFVGRPEVTLPAVDPTPRLDRLGPSARLRRQWYGTPLLVMPYAYDATATTIVDAVRRLGGVPVRDGEPG